jgi:hypothetical protein
MRIVLVSPDWSRNIERVNMRSFRSPIRPLGPDRIEV